MAQNCGDPEDSRETVVVGQSDAVVADPDGSHAWAASSAAAALPGALQSKKAREPPATGVTPMSCAVWQAVPPAQPQVAPGAQQVPEQATLPVVQQVPEVQVWPEPQAWLQVPQLAGSVWSEVQRVGQASGRVAGQAHAPAEQTSLARGQTWPQVPQFAGSVSFEVQAVPQASGSDGGQAQTPAEQVSLESGQT